MDFKTEELQERLRIKSQILRKFLACEMGRLNVPDEIQTVHKRPLMTFATKRVIPSLI